MTDKQIINDVDILYICSYGQTALPICVDLEHRYCKLKSQKSKKCNLRPVVSYKEYKRKEQECEKLKEDRERWKSNFNGKVSAIEELLQQLDQLKVENEDLKKQVNDLLNKPEIQDKILWKIDNEALLGSKDAWIYKLEQTIIKIKEIAEKQCVCGVDCIDMKQILQKISKCEVG